MKRVVVVLAFLACVVNLSIAEELAVLAHVHTTTSDGVFPVEINGMIAKTNGAQVMILSDHAEMASSRAKLLGAYPDTPGARSSILMREDDDLEAWISELKKQTNRIVPGLEVEERYSIPVIPGMEVGMGSSRHNHLLVWGGVPEDYRSIVYASGSAAEEPDRALGRIFSIAEQNRNMVLVQAHPFSSRYPFDMDFDPPEGLTVGVEFFNCFNQDEQLKCFARMLRLQADNPNNRVIATSGSDFHGYDLALEGFFGSLEISRELVDDVRTNYSRGQSSLYKPTLKRHLIVYDGNSNWDSIMFNLRAGRCYASFEPVGAQRIVSASAMPGETFNPAADEFEITFSGGKPRFIKVGFAATDGSGFINQGTLVGSGNTAKFRLREITQGRQGSLFFMTPNVVTSGIHLLRQAPRDVIQTPRVQVPPRSPRPSQPTPSQSPEQLLAGYPRLLHALRREDETTSVMRGITYENVHLYYVDLEAWAGVDENLNGRLIFTMNGIRVDRPIEYNGNRVYEFGDGILIPGTNGEIKLKQIVMGLSNNPGTSHDHIGVAVHCDIDARRYPFHEIKYSLRTSDFVEMR